MADICLVLVYGLPAAGKSSLIQTLINSASRQHWAGRDEAFWPIVVEYDSLMPADLEKHLILADAESKETSKSKQLSQWKQYREDILRCVDSLLSITVELGLPDPRVCSREPDSNQLDLRREDVFSKLTTALPSAIPAELKDKFCSGIQSGLPGSNTSTDRLRTCIFIDDNLYYSSMRYSYFQVARKYKIGFCQLYVHTDVNSAVFHNAQREAQVSQEVIGTMASKIEAPDMMKNSWEKHSLTVESNNIKLVDIFTLITEAMKDPVQPVEEVDSELQNQSREICSASFLYQSDQILRKLVSQRMSDVKDTSSSKTEMKSMASTLQLLRKQILQDLKTGAMSVPHDVVTMATDSSKDESSLLYEFLQKILSDQMRTHQSQDQTCIRIYQGKCQA